MKHSAVAEWFVRRMSCIILGLHGTDLQEELVKDNQDSKLGSLFIFQPQKTPMLTLSHFSGNTLGITAQIRCILLLVAVVVRTKGSFCHLWHLPEVLPAPAWAWASRH